MIPAQPRHWRSAADALAVLRRRIAPTRQELAAQLGLGSGPTSDLVTRLRTAGLVTEQPVPANGRGRPTTSLHAHPDGPLAAVLDIRHGDWRLGTCGLDGTVHVTATGRHDGADPEALVTRLRARVHSLAQTHGERLVAVGVTVPGQTDGSTLLFASQVGWRDLDLARISADLPVIVGNDATTAAVAEARRHEARVLLHVVVEVGVGGALIVDGQPVSAARGLHGEFGHLPFGDPAQRCPCGARGCWTIPFDADHAARRLHRPNPSEPRDWLETLFTTANPTEPEAALRTELAAGLGRGIAGLVNALAPEVVTLGGLADPLRRTSEQAFEHAFRDGLMDLHREQPPALAAARAGDDAVLVGAGLTAFDRVLDADRLARWVSP